jgi:vancomycin permeability regulator SanA
MQINSSKNGYLDGRQMKRHRLKTWLLRIALLLLLFFAASAIAIVWDGLRDNLRTADVAIVLGNEVRASGQPSARLQARLDKTAELYHQGLFQEVIVSGGIDERGVDEAAVMKEYLVRQGLNEAHIQVDSNGANTFLTAKNAAQIMREKNLQSALVISQYFHISRSKLALKRFGVAPVYSAHADFFEWRDVYSTAREVVGFYSYCFRSYR